MDAKLVVVGGGEARVTEVDLELPLTVGRGRSSGLALPHPLVSRQHCEIYEEEGKLVINDLGSLNGTFVGDQRINEPTFLMPGELLTIGTVTFRAVYEVAGNDVEFVEEESTSSDLPADNRTVRMVDQTVSDMSDVEEVEDIEDASTTDDDIAEAVDVEFADLDEIDDDDEVEVAEPIDIEATIPAPTKPKQATRKPAAKPTAAKPSKPQTTGSKPAAPKPRAAAAQDVEVVEEVEDVEFAAEDDVIPIDEDESSEVAAHDTKEVSPAGGDTEAAEGDDDDLQSFLQGLG